MNAPITWPERIPPLENGDRLTSAEFERRYHAMPNVKKAELIRGIVHMPSPVRVHQHALPHSAIMLIVTHYAAMTPGVVPLDNSTVRLGEEDQPQPDAALFLAPGRPGARVELVEDYLTGAPEFVSEVSSSSVSIDRHSKFESYQDNGVDEYLLWRVQDGEVDYFVRREGRFVPLGLHEGLYKSERFPGLWFDPRALVAVDLADCLATIQRGVASPEHAAFVARLAS